MERWSGNDWKTFECDSFIFSWPWSVFNFSVCEADWSKLLTMGWSLSMPFNLITFTFFVTVLVAPDTSHSFLLSPFSTRIIPRRTVASIRWNFNTLHVEEEEDGKCELVGNFSDHEQLANLEKLILEKKYGITPPSSDTTAVEVGVNEETDVEKLDNSTNLPVIPNAARKAPSHGECELYKWVQDEDWMNVTIPLPRPAIRDDVLLFVAPDSLDVKVKTSPGELGVISVSGRLSVRCFSGWSIASSVAAIYKNPCMGFVLRFFFFFYITCRLLLFTFCYILFIVVDITNVL
jgi:hypothetical protein